MIPTILEHHPLALSGNVPSPLRYFPDVQSTSLNRRKCGKLPDRRTVASGLPYWETTTMQMPITEGRRNEFSLNRPKGTPNRSLAYEIQPHQRTAFAGASNAAR